MDNETEPALPWLARLLQVGDSAFPTGGYAHSYGFEQIVQLGLVRDAPAMALYIEEHVWPALIYFELPVVRLAREAARRDDLPGLIDLADGVEASRSARELREASLSTGRRRLLAFQKTAPSPVLTRFAQAVETGRARPHHPVVYGLGLAALPDTAVLTSWAFQSLSAVCLSAPKLLRIGQNAAQRVLTASLVGLEEKISVSRTVEPEDLGWFDPLVEIASMQHEIAHERLFIS
jgi:urease accessory protein